MANPPQLIETPISEAAAPKAPKFKSTGFFQSFSEFSHRRIERLKKTILGDYYYLPKNKFKLAYKEKILSYLQAKYRAMVAELDGQNVKKFTNFDPAYAENTKFRNLRHMKESILKLKTHIQAAQDLVTQQQVGLKEVRANFLNEAAYEFTRQKRSAMGWGLVTGSIICSTVYRRGSNTRKAALLLTCGHVFGQISYHWNIDKYFDTVYPVFEEDAMEFVELEERERIKKEVGKPAGQSIVE